MKVIIERMLREPIPRWELLWEVGFEGRRRVSVRIDMDLLIYRGSAPEKQ
jgi:hypothetical protein